MTRVTAILLWLAALAPCARLDAQALITVDGQVRSDAGGIAGATVAAVDSLIRKIKERGVTILLIEHHMDLVMGVSDTISVLDFGQKIAEGSPRTIQKNKAVIAAYLGTEDAA